MTATESSRGMTDRVFQEILAQIVSGDLHPGTRLKESDLARRYDVSRGPVREALIRLAGKGIVEMNANRGALVADLTIERMTEALIMRATLEGMAARFAAAHGGGFIANTLNRTLLRMERAEADNNIDLFFDYHWQFHETICNASENEMLLEAWERYNTIFHMMIRKLTFSREFLGEEGELLLVPRIVTGSHTILRAIKTGDPDTAEDVIRRLVIVVGYELLKLPLPRAFEGMTNPNPD